MSTTLHPSQPHQLRKEIQPTAIHGLASDREPNQPKWSMLAESLQREAALRPTTQPSASLVKTETVAVSRLAVGVRYLLFYLSIYLLCLLNAL